MRTKDYGWVYGKGRLRIGYVRYSQWRRSSYNIRCWFFFAKNYPVDIYGYGGYFQFTLLGFQLGYCYHKGSKAYTNKY
jgi:hypothetical protein